MVGVAQDQVPGALLRQSKQTFSGSLLNPVRGRGHVLERSRTVLYCIRPVRIELHMVATTRAALLRSPYRTLLERTKSSLTVRTLPFQ
jgi:hypothetical protein